MNGVARSVSLARAFTQEQAEPERFYRLLAADSVELLGRYTRLQGAKVLDVGGGPGWYDDAFSRAGAWYCAVEMGPAELAQRVSMAGSATVAGDGTALPIITAGVDVAFSSNVLEHVPRPLALLDELVRVTRPGGVVFCAFTNWLSPWGGHETSPWHFLGGRRAAERYRRRVGHPPKNWYGRSLFPVHVADVLRWARRHPDVDTLDARPRYYPSWCRPIVAIPGVREILTWNLVTVLRRR